MSQSSNQVPRCTSLFPYGTLFPTGNLLRSSPAHILVEDQMHHHKHWERDRGRNVMSSKNSKDSACWEQQWWSGQRSTTMPGLWKCSSASIWWQNGVAKQHAPLWSSLGKWFSHAHGRQSHSSLLRECHNRRDSHLTNPPRFFGIKDLSFGVLSTD